MTNQSRVGATETISHELSFIDWVRGFSSLLVAISHAGGLVWDKSKLFYFSGALGVDFFIIVSGFLMTVTLIKKKEATLLRRDQLGSFYLRRFFRIAPLFYLAYFCSLFLQTTSFENFLLHVTFLNGLLPEYATKNAILPFWSITLDMQFYAVIPFILASFRKCPGWVAIFFLGLINTAASQLWGVYSKPGVLGSFALPTFLPLSLGLFTVGIILGLQFVGSRHAPPLWASALLILWTPFQHPFYAHSFVAALAAGLVLFRSRRSENFGLAGEKISGELRRVLRSIAKFLADYSYSLYLFHSFVAIFLAKLFLSSPVVYSLRKGWVFLATAVLLVGISYAISLITFRFVEKPGVKLGEWLQRSLRDVASSR